MKTVFTNTIAELKKEYTNLTVILFVIGAVTSFFTNLEIVSGNLGLTILKMTYFVASAAGLMTILIVFLYFFEEYLRTTQFTKFSIAKPFVKTADHVLVNIKSSLALISIAFILSTVYTRQVSASAVSFWFVTIIVIMFAVHRD